MQGGGATHSLEETLVISTFSRSLTYKLLNPDLATHEMYTNKLVDEIYR